MIISIVSAGGGGLSRFWESPHIWVFHTGFPPFTSVTVVVLALLSLGGGSYASVVFVVRDKSGAREESVGCSCCFSSS